MNLPKSGEKVTLKEIKLICKEYGRTDLWKRIKKNRPKRPFVCDG
jgi:hypothetical protein